MERVQKRSVTADVCMKIFWGIQMEFYKKLNIQLAIVVPSNRMATLASYMDSVVGLIKLKNQIRIEKLYG